jgi:GTP-binding protein
VLNKIDLLPADEADKLCAEIVRRLRWKGPTFKISAAANKGTKELVQAVMRAIEEIDAKNKAAAATADAEA